MGEAVKDPPGFKGKKNIYTCRKCCGHIVTVDVDDGVTPFMLKCRATEGCDGTMHSSLYRVFDQKMAAAFEWYRPSSLDGVRRCRARSRQTRRPATSHGRVGAGDRRGHGRQTQRQGWRRRVAGRGRVRRRKRALRRKKGRDDPLPNIPRNGVPAQKWPGQPPNWKPNDLGLPIEDPSPGRADRHRGRALPPGRQRQAVSIDQGVRLFARRHARAVRGDAELSGMGLAAPRQGQERRGRQADPATDHQLQG